MKGRWAMLCNRCGHSWTSVFRLKKSQPSRCPSCGSYDLSSVGFERAQ